MLSHTEALAMLSLILGVAPLTLFPLTLVLGLRIVENELYEARGSWAVVKVALGVVLGLIVQLSFGAGALLTTYKLLEGS